MTLKELSNLNEQFQEKASEISELMPGSHLHAFASNIIRSSRKMDNILGRIISAKSEMAFYNQVESLEEEMDELIYMMDKLEQSNRKGSIQTITDFLKRGYELLSLYSLCCDQILEKKLKKHDEFE